MKLASDQLLSTNDELTPSLQAEIPGHEWEWAEQALAALGRVERSLRQHIVDAEAPTGLFTTEVDLTRPTLVRQVGKLLREHEQFLEQASTLRKQVASAAEPFRPHLQATPAAGVLPEPATDGVVMDLGAVRQSIEEFAAALMKHRERETDLAIESVTTDLGAGD